MVAPGDAGALGAAHQRLARRPELRERLGAAGRAAAAAYTYEAAAAGFGAPWRVAIADAGRGPTGDY